MKRLLSILLLVFAFSYLGFAADVTLDMFEYSTDDSAQAAYVSSDSSSGYTADLVPTMTGYTTPSGTVTTGGSDSGTKMAWHAFDNAVGTNYNWEWTGHQASWVAYQFTSAKTIARYTIKDCHHSLKSDPKDWTFQGSNDGSSWTTLDTQTNETGWSTDEVRTYSFANSTSYTYYKLDVTAINGDPNFRVGDIEMMELITPNLQCYSESTIKQQGSYSLKGVAAITDSLNDTLTRTVSPTIDLSGKDSWIFWIYSSRTGSNIKVGIHDSGGTTTESTPDVTSANTWQKVTVDVSGVTDANKDVIDSIIITPVNADAANTFYFDWMYGATAEVEHPTTSQLLLGGIWFKDGKLQYSDFTRHKRGTTE